MIRTHKGWQFESAEEKDYSKPQPRAKDDPYHAEASHVEEQVGEKSKPAPMRDSNTQLAPSPAQPPPFQNKHLDTIESGLGQVNKFKTGLQNQGKQVASQIRGVKKAYPQTYNMGTALVGTAAVAGLMGLLTGKKNLFAKTRPKRVPQAVAPVPPPGPLPISNAPPRKGIVGGAMNSIDHFLNKRRW